MKQTVFPDVILERRPCVGTPVAAHWLDRQQQTLRGWACTGLGPLQPKRINGRLSWNVSEIRKLLGVAE